MAITFWQEDGGSGNGDLHNETVSEGSIGLEKPNNWAFDTTQFDSILKRLKVQAVQSNDTGIEKKATKVETETSVGGDKPDTVSKATRPQGRYKRRERGKLVSEYSLKDLEGILVKKGEVSRCNDDSDAEVDVAKTSDSLYFHVEESKACDIPPDWWGHKFGFVSGGLLGAESRRKRLSENTNSTERTAFHEDDQEKLYKLVQDKSTTGKQGLGIKDRPKKVAGCYFEGKKTTFSSDDDNNNDSADIGSQEKQSGDIIKEEKTDGSRVKLKKLCRRILQRVPGESLKLKQVKVIIDEHSSSVFADFSSKRDAVAYLKQKLEGSKKFCIEGRRVRLASKRC